MKYVIKMESMVNNKFFTTSGKFGGGYDYVYLFEKHLEKRITIC